MRVVFYDEKIDGCSMYGWLAAWSRLSTFLGRLTTPLCLVRWDENLQ